jgi:hypothetical protein
MPYGFVGYVADLDAGQAWKGSYVLALTQINMGVISTFIKAEQIQLAFITVETERPGNFCVFMF